MNTLMVVAVAGLLVSGPVWANDDNNGPSPAGAEPGLGGENSDDSDSASVADDAASARCSTRDLAGRWHMLGHYLQADSAWRYRCTYTVNRDGFFRAVEECTLDSPTDGVEHWTTHRVEVRVRRDCEARWKLNFLETTCSFEGALTRDKQLLTGVALCQELIDDTPLPSTMTLSIVRQSVRNPRRR
jgi:hypothetical protein